MSAKAYLLCSSSKGNCAYIKNGDDEFLIDAGASLKQISLALCMLGTSISNIQSIFITHEHSDHIRGLNCISKKYGIPIYAPAGCCDYISRVAPFASKCLMPRDGSKITLSSTEVYSVRTPHDALASVGFRIDTGDGHIGYFTDIGCLTEDILGALSGCEHVVIESNHDIELLRNGRYSESLKRRILGKNGHLSNTDCARVLPLLVKYGTHGITLAHLSRDNNRPQLAYDESRGSLASNGFEPCEGGTVNLRVAAYDEITELA